MVGPEGRDGGTVTHIWESSHRGQALILFATITGSSDVKVEAAKLFFTAKLLMANIISLIFVSSYCFQVLFAAIVTVHLLEL